MRWWLPLLFVAVACGSSANPEEVKSERRQLESLAAETKLLEQLAQAGHATRPFEEAHTRYLEETTEEHRKKLVQAGQRR